MSLRVVLRQGNVKAVGGGVAEMLSRVTRTMNQTGFNASWMTLNTEDERFFVLTKKIHNYIHGTGPDVDFSDQDREVYESVGRENAESEVFQKEISNGDIIVLHDPQPLGMVIPIREKFGSGVKIIFRCHIGLDEHNFQTICAWTFLKPYISQVDHCIFTSPEYVPSFVKNVKCTIMYPSLSPFNPKNQELSTGEILNILIQSGLTKGDDRFEWKVPFEHQVKCLFKDPMSVGIPFSPIVTQISRWDRLKGWIPLIKGWVEMKKNIHKYSVGASEEGKNLLRNVKLVLAGPNPEAIQDDPEGLQVFEELTVYFADLEPDLQDTIAILSLPMNNVTQNALIVNALQRCSLVVFQNSLREGFGLTCTEAMFKRIPVIGSRQAVGIRLQIRDRIDGRLVNVQDSLEIAQVLAEVLLDEKQRLMFGVNAEKRAIDNFLVYKQIEKYSEVFQKVLNNGGNEQNYSDQEDDNDNDSD
ncbi:hypothetical protein FDP41_012268 [Naegleria fowleri]|uniref:Uncharacterized protein n=1 Tax=Naegleria fowleri TaxID=5763 RepID=A0A6A5C3H0_NAEFO|nr:uncharacterized protein FDP41_012268 [Naegleria fowleri]KAF0981611.1 hypothetical protein FDP41_012268 [Naegleria fowleri]